QNLADEIACQGIYVIGEGEFPFSNLLEKRGDGFLVKGQFATQEGIENDTTRPDINLWSGIQFPSDHLWSSIIRRSATRLEETSIVHNIAEAKISNFDKIIGIKKQVLQ